MTASLVEFVLARADEQERSIRSACVRTVAMHPDCQAEAGEVDALMLKVFRRDLAQIEATRRISETVYSNIDPTDDHQWGYQEAVGMCLRWLAQVYSDHPDYDPHWWPGGPGLTAFVGEPS